MSEDLVVRRFEVRTPSLATLDEIELALREAVGKLPAERVEAKIERIERPPTVCVRIQGPGSSITMVRDSVSRIQGSRVLRDWIDVPARARRRDPSVPLAIGSGDSVRPDLRALLRIDPELRTRRERGKDHHVVVAIVDSGLMVDHPHLRNRLWSMKTKDGGHVVHGARCMGGVGAITDYDITDQDGHGTMLAGSILATANSVSDIEIMAVKFFDVRTEPVAVNAAQAIRFAVKNGAQIMNLSFDLGIGSIELEEAIRSACAAGVLVVIAAGNTGSDNDCYPLVPALYARVMASGQYDEKPTFSNFGKETVDLAAPGVNIESTRRLLSSIPPSRIYRSYTGTSAAAAQVTGAAALLKSQNPDWKARDLKACLMETVDRLPWLKCVNGGRLNLGWALSHRPSTLKLSLANPPVADVAQGDLVARDRESRRRRRTGRRET